MGSTNSLMKRESPRPSPAPRIGTVRNLDRPTRGLMVGRFAERLGLPLMPWQQHVADVAGEVDPKTGLPAYREVVLLVPRQSGKTTLLLAQIVHRAFAFQAPQLTRYAAQTGDDAIAKFEEHIEILEKTAFRRLFTKSDVNGSKYLRWNNGSRYTPTATTKRSGHGKTLDQGIIDEAFAQIDFRTEQAMRPAMITRRDAQLFIVSTAGDPTSVLLNKKIADNRARLEAEPDAPSRVAYLEWSAPEDADPADETQWWGCMPALGRTVHIDEIRAELESMETRDFRRAYLNQTDVGEVEGSALPLEVWATLADPGSHVVSAYAFGLDVANDRSWSSVGVSGENPSGGRHVGLIRHDRGTHWPVEYIARKAAEVGSTQVAVAAHSQAALMTPALEKAGLTVIPFNRADVAAACAGFLDDINDRTLSYTPGQADLEIAIAGTVWTAGDTRTFSRGASRTVISPLYSVVLARHSHLVAPETVDVLETIA